MARRLSDEDVAKVRVLSEEGHNQQQIADMVGCSRPQVSKILSGVQHQTLDPGDGEHEGTVLSTVQAMLNDIGLDPKGDVGAAIAVTLAAKADAATAAGSAQSAIALPGLVKSLNDALEALVGRTGGDRSSLLLLTALGAPDPEALAPEIDAYNIDSVSLMKIKRQFRRAGQPIPDTLQRAIELATAHD